MSTAFPRMRGGDPKVHIGQDSKEPFSPHVRGLREGVTCSAAADAFLSAADPLRAAPLTQAGRNVFYHSAEIAQENSGSVHKETTAPCYTFTRSFFLKGACSLYEPTHLCRTFP